MEIRVTFPKNIIPAAYSKQAKIVEDYHPVKSFPFEVEDIPKEAKYLCVALLDWDAIPVCGFPWIHWVSANIPVRQKFEADFSRKSEVQVHGYNSLVSKYIDNHNEHLQTSYIGPTPPDQDHIYTLYVYAIDQELELMDGFYLNDMLRQIETCLVDRATIDLIGKA